MNPKKEFDTALSSLSPEERSTYIANNPNVNVGGVQQNAVNGSYVPIDTTITRDALSNTEQPIKVNPAAVSSTPVGLSSELSSLAQSENQSLDKQDALAAETKAAATKAGTEVTTSKKGILDFLGLRKGESQLTNDAYSETNQLGTTVDETSKKVRDVNNKITAIDIRQNEQLKQLKDTFTGTKQGFADASNAIIRNNASTKADLYIEKLMAQGDYESAKSIADRKVDMLMEQDKLTLEKLMFDYEDNKALFDKNEQRQFELAADDRKRALATKEDELKTINQLAIDSKKNGAPDSVVANILASKSVADAIRLTVNAPATFKAPEVKSINGVDMQWNTSSGTWEPIAAGSNIPGAPDQVQKSLDQIKFLRDTAAEATKLSSAAGASGVSKFLGDTFVGDTEYRQLEALTNTLKTNVLSLMTDPGIKKFFGPQMSNADVLLMTSAGTTLNPSANTGTQMKNELKRLDDLFNRMQTAVNMGQKTQTQNIITAPTGELIKIID